MAYNLSKNYTNNICYMISGKKVPPSAEELAERFLKRTEFITDPQNTSLLFTFFAQHFTHCFFKTDYPRDPGMQWGRHGVDSSHIYGQGVERESKLRTFKDGKMKSQVNFKLLSTYIILRRPRMYMFW